MAAEHRLRQSAEHAKESQRAVFQSSYNTHLYKVCDDAGMDHFCMHALRHTYATRAIESGMQPKILQQLLGQASIKTTMDTYVHVTDESLYQAVESFEAHPGLAQ